jgi:hypothetical protein
MLFLERIEEFFVGNNYLTHHFSNTNINIIAVVGIPSAKIAKISPIPIV